MPTPEEVRAALERSRQGGGQSAGGTSVADVQAALERNRGQRPGLFRRIGRGLDASASGITQGATFGFADEITAGMMTPVVTATNLMGLSEGPTRPSEVYSEELERIRARERQMAEDSPVAYTGGAIIGGLAGAPGQAVTRTAQGLSAAGRAAAATPSTASTVGRAVGSGAAGGALGGFGASEGGLENRLAGAAVGGAAGGALGAAIPLAAAAGRSVGRIGSNLAGVNNPSATTERLLLRGLEDAGMSPDDAMQALERARRINPEAPYTLADTGQPMQRLARTVETVPGPGSRALTEFLDERQAGQTGRVVRSVRRAIQSDDFTGTVDDLMARRSSEAQPLYQQALSAEGVWNDRLGRLLDDPITRTGMARGLEIQRLEAAARGQPFDPADYAVVGFNDAGDPVLGGVPNMRTWDMIKSGLDDIIEQYRDPTSGVLRLDRRGRAVDEFRRSLVNQLDELNPDYAAARAAWAGPSQSLDALDMGRRFARGDMEDVRRSFASLSDSDKDFFRIGVARQLREMVEKSPDTSDAVKRIFNNPDQRARLRTLFDTDEAFEAFEDTLRLETDMFRTRATATGGSPTGRIEAEQSDASIIDDVVSEALRPEGNIRDSLIRATLNRGLNRARGIGRDEGELLAQALMQTTPEGQAGVLGRLSARSESDLARSQQLRDALVRATLGAGNLSGQGGATLLSAR